MAIRAGDRPGLGGAAKLVADRARSIVRLELELAASELKKKIGAVGIGVGLLLGAAALVFFAVACAIATIAAAIATTLSTWLALLIVSGGLFLFAGLLVAVGVVSIRRGTPPVPTKALEEARLTAKAVKKNGSH